MASDTNDNITTIVPYGNEIQECHRLIVFAIASLEVRIQMEKKLCKRNKKTKQEYYFAQHINYNIENKINQQQRASLLAGVSSNKSRVMELHKQLLLVREKRQTINANRNMNLKKYVDQWLICKNRFESIHFVKFYFDINNKIEIVNENMNATVNEDKKLCTDINLKRHELLNLEKNYIIQLADYMNNQRQINLKLINEKTNENRPLDMNKYSMKNKLVPSTVMECSPIYDKKKKIKINKTHDPLELPKLHLLDMDLSPSKIGQAVNYTNETAMKTSVESYSTIRFNILKKGTKTKTNCREHITTYFTSPTMIEETKKYSDRKLIHILEDIKLNPSGTYEFVSQLKSHQLKHVTTIDAGESQHETNKDEQKDKYPNKPEVIEEIGKKKKSPPEILTNHQPQTQNPQEKRVTFDSVITINDLENMPIDNPKSQEDATLNSTGQFNTSNASDDSYKKIKEFVFKKHNLNLSPEFTYSKNSVPKETNKVITSKFFEDKTEDHDINLTEERMDMSNDEGDQNKLKNNMIEIDPVILNKANTSGNITEVQEGTLKGAEPLAGPSFSNYFRGLPGSLNISMNNTTGCEDDDAEFPQCIIDSSLLLSPKADSEMLTNDTDISQVLSQELPSFLSGLKKTGLSFFTKTSSVKKSESGEENTESNKFNFTFGEDKVNRGGLFNMFR